MDKGVTEIPNIRCSACGSVIGNKFISFNMLVECGSSRFEAFDALDVFRYCCRKDIANSIVFFASSDHKIQENNNSSTILDKTDKTDKVKLNLSEDKFNRLTASIGTEVVIVPLSHSSNNGKDFINSLKEELNESLSKPTVEDIPFQRKEIENDKCFNSIVNESTENIGSGFKIIKIRKVYTAR